MKHEVFTPTISNKKAKVRNVIITLLLTLLVVINGFAQQFIDIVNAPLNPVGYIENKNQLHLKGDIAYIESEDYLNFDKNGNRLFLYYNFLDKEKARGTKSTYLELDNQKRLVYKENFFLEVKTFYTYNPNGTIAKIEVQSQYPSVRTFEYDNNKRMIKQTEKRDAKTTVTDYAYQTNGNRIVISASETVTENNQSTSRTYQYTYENGLMMKYKEKDLEDTYTYTYDTKGNWLTKSSRFGTTKRQFYYHSELGEWDKWSWKYVKDYAWLPYLTIGNRNVHRLNYSSKDLDNFTDVLFFEPITGTTLVAENVVTANGLSKGVGNGKVSVLKAKNLMYKSVQGNIKFFVEGSNQSGNLKQVFVGKTYVIYDASSLQTYWCRDFEKGKKFNVFEDLGKDAFLWYKSEKNDFYFWQKGDYVTQALGYTLGTLSDDDNLIIYQNQKPVFVIENLTNSIQNTFYKAVPYSGQPIPKNNSQTTTTTAGTNTSGKTTETRYYNGKYTKETALQKANDFFNRTNGEKITFTKMEKKSDYQFVGNWIIKGADESLQSKIEYLFEDDALKIKINEIVLKDKYGTLKMDKNHKDEAVRKTAENLYTSINDLYVKAVFLYLDINNNQLKNTTTTGSNTKTADLYSGLSTEAKAFMETYKTNPNGLKNYVQNLHKSWEEKGSSTSDINAKYIDMYQELYTKDKASAFELLMNLPFKWKEPHLKTITTFLTDEQKAYNRQKAQEIQKKYSNSYNLKTN